MNDLPTSRRSFLKSTVIAGVTVYLAPLQSHAYFDSYQERVLEAPLWDPSTRKISYRTDGKSKVTGAKVFAYDIRAKDMAHWPQQQGHALILRTTVADRIYEGFDLSLLGSDLQPNRIVEASDLSRDQIEFPPFFGADLLLPIGKTPAYLGQAAAILIYHDFNRYRQAKQKLKFRDEVMQYGAITGPLERNPWGGFRTVRVGGETPDDDDIYSSMTKDHIWPLGMSEYNPVWPTPRKEGELNEEGMYYADLLARGLESPPSNNIVFSRRYTTQSSDTAAMESENTNGWYDPIQKTLHMVVPSQSPQRIMRDMVEMIAKSTLPVSQVYFHPCYTVGYGSKDLSDFAFYGVIATLYGGGVPIRLANDRFEQFQTSLKRHPFKIDYSIEADRTTGKFKLLKAELECNGGGRQNFSPNVMRVGTVAAQCIYYFPKSDLLGIARSSRGVDAGSVRGYGTLQTMASTEMMVDELAEELKIDPIELRLRNVFKSSMKNTQGAIPGGAIRADEVLEKAAQHPLWVDRKIRKEEYEQKNPGKLYGVGFACAQKDFGNGAEAAFARVEITPQGKILLYHSGPEIGTGMSTAQAVVCAKILGHPADETHCAVTDWSILPIEVSGNPRMMAQEVHDELAKNPRWSPNYCSSASASNSAYYYSHATEQAARVIFDHGLWPAALAIWSKGIDGGQAAPYVVRKEDARWVEGGLTANGMETLSITRLVKQAYEMNGVTGAAVHVFNRWAWAQADFMINNDMVRLDSDALALRYGARAYAMEYRYRAIYPSMQRNTAAVTYYSAHATIAEVAIDTTSGEVELLRHHSVLECGNMIVPELVSGQIEGGSAMGIGHALYEHLPLYEDGPGNGRWNFNRYHVPLAKNVAVWTQTHEVLPALSETDPPKGMGEVVMIPIAAAIANAVADATGHRFRSFPIRPKDIQGVLI